MTTGARNGELLELELDHQLATLVSKWDFRLGQIFEMDIFNKFRSSVHHPSSSLRGVFHFCLRSSVNILFASLKVVSLALHSVLGGTPVGFHVTYLKDHHYRFSVASKQVGFEVRDLKRIITIILMFTSTSGGMGGKGGLLD
jgi:hypothetical protein